MEETREIPRARLPEKHAAVSRRLLVAGAATAGCSPRSSVAVAGAVLVVLGAAGGTGRKCVEYAAGKGYKVRACTRDGKLPEGSSAEAFKCSVTSTSELAAAVQGATGVIFAASASKTVKADDAEAVDYQGLINTARACIDAQVPRLVIVSSGAVSKPDSSVYQFLNLFGSIMARKIQGEDSVRQLYAEDQTAASYTIIRPGGLTQGESKGPSLLELNQGDEKSGRISRADVAALCVECIADASAADTTFECYDRGTGQALANVGLNNIFRGGASDFRSGRERVGSTWQELFAGLQMDSSRAPK